jgi:uncharacterized protein (TIGR03790 family)
VLLVPGVRAARGPEHVLVIVNDASPLSRSIGEYYARKRGIPTAQICRVRASTEEWISRSEYQSQILVPVLRCLASGGLTDRILYLVTTGGLPLAVQGGQGLDGDAASVDSELALAYPIAKGARPTTPGMLPNPYFGKRGMAFGHPQFPLYLVTRLAAYDFAVVKRMIDDAAMARNRGKFVIDLKAWDSSPGNEWLRDAAIRLPAGRVVFNEDNHVVMGQKDVIGYAGWGSNDPDRKDRFLKFGWLPGSIATEFVSLNARTLSRPPANWNIGPWKSPKDLWFAGAPQTLSADYLFEGASAATGNVSEPWLHTNPRPEILLPEYAGGRNLAESAWMSIPFVSWRTVVFGDPLMALR